MIRTTLFGIFLILGTMMLAVAKEETPDPLNRAAIITIDGAIGPATVEYVKRAMEIVRKRDHKLVILKINTPGGLVDSTRKINTMILNGPVPIVGYVAPSGAHAASAGTYILYAAHIAAMAPGTNLGAATPVRIGGPDTQSNKPKVIIAHTIKGYGVSFMENKVLWHYKSPNDNELKKGIDQLS